MSTVIRLEFFEDGSLKWDVDPPTGIITIYGLFAAAEALVRLRMLETTQPRKQPAPAPLEARSATLGAALISGAGYGGDPPQMPDTYHASQYSVWPSGEGKPKRGRPRKEKP